MHSSWDNKATISLDKLLNNSTKKIFILDENEVLVHVDYGDPDPCPTGVITFKYKHWGQFSMIIFVVCFAWKVIMLIFLED